jgi:hypothetical protein
MNNVQAASGPMIATHSTGPTNQWKTMAFLTVQYAGTSARQTYAFKFKL